MTARESESVLAIRRSGAMASSSSTKMIAGGFRLASANTLRRFSSVWPPYVPTTSGPLM